MIYHKKLEKPQLGRMSRGSQVAITLKPQMIDENHATAGKLRLPKHRAFRDPGKEIELLNEEILEESDHGTRFAQNADVDERFRAVTAGSRSHDLWVMLLPQFAALLAHNPELIRWRPPARS